MNKFTEHLKSYMAVPSGCELRKCLKVEDSKLIIKKFSLCKLRKTVKRSAVGGNVVTVWTKALDLGID